MGGSLYRELARLPGLEGSELRKRYVEVFGVEARMTQKQQLIRRIGWKLQALAQGDISEQARRRALQHTLQVLPRNMAAGRVVRTVYQYGTCAGRNQV